MTEPIDLRAAAYEALAPWIEHARLARLAAEVDAKVDTTNTHIAKPLVSLD